MTKSAHMRTGSEELARRLSCATTAARTLAAAAARSRLTEQLTLLVGEWQERTPAGGRGCGTLTTVVVDEIGPYVLETEAGRDNGARAHARPARITLLVEATTPGGGRACLGVPTDVAFLGSDAAEGHAELSQPIVVAGVITADEVAERIRETFLVRSADQPDGEHNEAAFMSLARTAAATALAAGLASDTMEAIVTTKLTISSFAPYRATATAVAARWPDHVGEGTASGNTQQQTLGVAAHTAVEALRESIEDSAAQAEDLSAPNNTADEKAGDTASPDDPRGIAPAADGPPLGAGGA